MFIFAIILTILTMKTMDYEECKKLDFKPATCKTEKKLNKYER